MSNIESSTPECNICYEVYNLKERKPVSFMCGHGFCERCVYSIRNIRRDQTGYYIRGHKFMCPVCKTECSQFIYNRDLMDWIEHTYHSNPVIQTLEEALSKVTNEIEKTTREYSSIEKEIKRIKLEIKELQKGHHILFDQHFGEVRKGAQVEYDMIINDAKEDANRITNDAKEDANRITNEVKVVGQHKRNFITKYDDMIDNLQQFKTLMKQLEITHPGGKLAKKEVRKLLEQIIGWEISEFIKPAVPRTAAPSIPESPTKWSSLSLGLVESNEPW